MKEYTANRYNVQEKLLTNISNGNIFNSSVNKLSDIAEKSIMESINDSMFFKLIDDKRKETLDLLNSNLNDFKDQDQDYINAQTIVEKKEEEERVSIRTRTLNKKVEPYMVIDHKPV